MLQALMQSPDAAVSREQLLRTAWGYQGIGETRTVDVHIQRLRRKIGSSCIENRVQAGLSAENGLTKSRGIAAATAKAALPLFFWFYLVPLAHRMWQAKQGGTSMEKGSSLSFVQGPCGADGWGRLYRRRWAGADGEEHLHCPLHGGAGFAPHGPWPQAGPAAG